MTMTDEQIQGLISLLENDTDSDTYPGETLERCKLSARALRQLQAENNALREDKRRLVTALEWYADDRRYNYDQTCCLQPYYPNGDMRRKAVEMGEGALEDEGSRARAALHASEGGE